MATWTTTLGQPGNMLLAFTFASLPINDLNLLAANALGEVKNNTTYTIINGGVLEINYVSPAANLTASGNNPTGGTYTSLTVARTNGVGTLTGIPSALFLNIDNNNAWRVLDGNDTLTGDVDKDTLTGGYGGNDFFDGKSNDDTFMVAALAGAPTHTFLGGSGTDTVVVGANIFGAGLTSLDLRASTFSNVDALRVANGIETHINASQIATGLLAPTAALSGGGTVHIHMPTGQTLNLSGIANNGVTLLVHGSAGADTIVGTGSGERITGGAGRDVMTGGLGPDVFDFDATTDSAKPKAARDLITDFLAGADKIDLSTIDANGSKAGDPLFKFIKKHDFGEKAGQLRFEKVNKPGTDKDVTRVEGDTDGNGKADFKIELTGLYKLLETDFVL